MHEKPLKTQNTTKVPDHFEEICALLQVNEPVKQQAIAYYEKIQQEGGLRRRKVKVVWGAALYVAARAHGVLLDICNIAKAANVCKPPLRRYVWVLAKLFDLTSHPVDLKQALFQLTDRLGVAPTTRQEAWELLNQVLKAGLEWGTKAGSLLGAIMQVACAGPGTSAASMLLRTRRPPTRALSSLYDVSWSPDWGLNAIHGTPRAGSWPRTDLPMYCQNMIGVYHENSGRRLSQAEDGYIRATVEMKDGTTSV